MTEIEYRNRSISQLVSQLNSLGEAKVVLEPIRLLAIHEHDSLVLKRFKNTRGQQFFSCTNNDKKYEYNQIVQNIHLEQLSLVADLYARGFNVSLMLTLPKEQVKVTQFLGEVSKWIGEAVYSALQFGEHQTTDLVTETKIAQRDLQKQLKYYKVKSQSSLIFMDKMLRNQTKTGINMLKIKKVIGQEPSNNQLTIIVLPQQFFNPEGKSSDFLSTARSQLTQIFNYLKINTAKKYQHFSKLLTKRLPITNVIASLLLEQSYCMVLNWMNEGHSQNLTQKLTFYDKVKGLTAFLKIEEQKKTILSELPFQLSPSSRKQAVKVRQSKKGKTDRTPIAHLLSDQNQLQYCRSFQRKTHKYSINDINEGQQCQELFSNKVSWKQELSEFVVPSGTSPVTHFRSQRVRDTNQENRQFDVTVPKKMPFINQNMKESEEIAILKANYAVQISQYHQTIQQLNRKILALTHQNKLQELYSIHQRQLMLLQLKIKQLRNDIATLTVGADDKSYKAMVRKLNDEVKRIQKKNTQQKLSSGKMATLEKQVQQTKRKYDESESSRKKLAYQLEYLTKRLKICDAEIEHLSKREGNLNNLSNNTQTAIATASTNKLSVSDLETLREVDILLGQAREGSEQACRFLTRKITNVLQDLSGSRNIILDCNDFLMQLEQHLQQKLGSKEPQIVLDCNKFIRSFLMDNLNIL